MDLKYLIKEQLENYISELVPDNAATPIQQKIKNLSKDDILLIPKANNRRYEISFRDPEIDAQFKAQSEVGNPSIMIDPTSYNYILTVEPIPQSFRNLGLGKKIYEKLSDQLGFISSSDKDKTTDTDRSVDATRVWDSLKRISSNYFIEFPNKTIFLISPNIQDDQEDQILDYFEKTQTDINSVITNLPPNWKKGLELALNRNKRQIPNLVSEFIQEAYDDVGVEFVKTKRDKLNSYTNYTNKKVMNGITLLHIKDNRMSDGWYLWGDVYAFDNEDGTEVGHVSYGKPTKLSMMKAAIDVRPDKRRQGIASEMYKWVEELTGETLYPDVPHSDSAAKLWGNPKRQFGAKNVNEEDTNIDQSNLNKILQGYLEAALWTEEDNLKSQMGDDEVEDDEPEDESDLDKLIRMSLEYERKPFMSFIVENIDPDSKIQAYLDIKTFINYAGKDAVMEAIQDQGLERLGHDIWLTRNHHGAGFFDHNYEHEKQLMDAAHKLQSVDMYITDDNKLVFSNT